MMVNQKKRLPLLRVDSNIEETQIPLFNTTGNKNCKLFDNCRWSRVQWLFEITSEGLVAISKPRTSSKWELLLETQPSTH